MGKKKESIDPMKEPLTPQEEESGDQVGIKINIDEYDLDEVEDDNFMDPMTYEAIVKNSTLQMQRSSSLRDLGTKEVDKFKKLSVYHDTLVEDAVITQDVMTPQ